MLVATVKLWLNNGDDQIKLVTDIRYQHRWKSSKPFEKFLFIFEIFRNFRVGGLILNDQIVSKLIPIGNRPFLNLSNS